jgi:hypothetical protein
MSGHPLRDLKESAGDIAPPVEDADDLDAVLHRAEEDEVIPNGEHPETGREIKTSLAHKRHGSQPVQGVADAVQQTVGVGRAVLGDVAPDIHQVGLGAWACEDVGHVTPAPTVPTLAGRGA